ncbi:MAG TPA: GNAT family N-acetyltransferase [Flavilitoribacter sp.]|nr:GNAT family N-acetyltransferase [Flavilitoribacter sp.]HMQ87068.1 GNAT family N-acetyltransferase [Flavilitoribacter sp.]
MKLKHRPSGKLLEAVISEIANKDYSAIKKDPGFSFDWETEKRYEVYKMYLLSDDNTILGLVSLIDIPQEFRIHLNLLEVSKPHQGKNKELDLIAGCLIAHAAEIAIKRGYYGFVSIEPKTQLIDHYQHKYGFRQYGRFLGIEGPASQNLVNKYLGNE